MNVTKIINMVCLLMVIIVVYYIKTQTESHRMRPQYPHYYPRMPLQPPQMNYQQHSQQPPQMNYQQPPQMPSQINYPQY